MKTNQTVWSILPTALKARIVLFEASVELDSGGDLSRVKALTTEAKAIDPSVKQDRLAAVIALREVGPEVALDMLGDAEDIDTLNLRAALLLEMGRADDCLALLSLEKKGGGDA